jgi:HlyD family secretion protein
MEKIKKHRKLIIITVIILVIGGALLWGRFGYSGGQSKLPYDFVKVTQGDFIRQIKLTGTVKAASDIQLAFARSGKVDTVSVKAGDQVKAGQIIAQLVKTDISADYLSAVASWQMAQAQVSSAQANLDDQNIKKQDMINGAKSQDVAVSEAQVQSAEKGVTDAQTSLANVQAEASSSLQTLYTQIDSALANSYNNAYDVVYHTTDPMFEDSASADPQLVFETPLESQAKFNAETERVAAVKAVAALSSDQKSLAGNYANYADVFSRVDSDLSVIGGYLASLNAALNSTAPNDNFNQSAIAADQAAVSGAISSINGSISAINSLKQAVDLQNKVNQNNIFAVQAAADQAQNALDLANDQLTLKKSSASTEELAMQDEQIKQAEAALSSAQAQLNSSAAGIDRAKSELANATIVAPIDGVITSVNLDPGESVNASVPVIGLQSAGKFQIETYLPELYIGDVKAQDAAKISFDAFGQDRLFDAKVISVDPAAQTVNGTLAYRTLLEFSKEEPDIKTGLTANISLIVADDKNMLSVPESSVIKEEDESFVILASGDKKEVTIGKTSGNGQIEILSGLTADDLVADFGTVSATK